MRTWGLLVLFLLGTTSAFANTKITYLRCEYLEKPLGIDSRQPRLSWVIEAEERGQAEAIARNLLVMSRLTVPIVSVVIGEGGSGGALALGVSDRVLMLEHSVYSVISPEGCAAILWDNPQKVQDAASALKMTAKDLLEFGVIDDIVPEPIGGAHREPKAVCTLVGKSLSNQLYDLADLSVEQLLGNRDRKYRKIGAVGGLPHA